MKIIRNGRGVRKGGGFIFILLVEGRGNLTEFFTSHPRFLFHSYLVRFNVKNCNNCLIAGFFSLRLP